MQTCVIFLYFNFTVNCNVICVRSVFGFYFSPSNIVQPTPVVLTKTAPILSLKIQNTGSMTELQGDVSIGDELTLQMSSPGKTAPCFLISQKV